MATDSTQGVYDLLILVDATYSMVNYLESLQISLPKVISISRLTDSFERIGLLAYRDYTEANRKLDGMLEWSGWLEANADADDDGTVGAKKLMEMASSLTPIGGGDYPEATKSGLARAYQLMRENATTMILLYTDAPPHCYMVADRESRSNYHLEQEALRKMDSYGGYGYYFADWVSASKQLHQGPRKAHVFCFLDQSLGTSAVNAGYYNYLSTITRGACLTMTDAKPQSIAKVTVDTLLAWMGTEKAGVEKTVIPAKLMRYKSGKDIKSIKHEMDPAANSYFWAGDKSTHLEKKMYPYLPLHISDHDGKRRSTKQLEENLAETTLDSELLKKYLPKRKTPVADFAKRYATDDQYKKLVGHQLKDVIQQDVASMSLNPVFGTLWRAICNDRENPDRDVLITMFGNHVEKIANADEKGRMKNWLEESYDYATEILEMLDSLPADECFPCVYLDPTIEFAAAKKKGEKSDDDEDEENRPITAFRRDELLEIGRSCDGRILRRLGKVLTRITCAESAAELPEHIAATTNKEVPKIPLSLISEKHGRKFWKVLLHIVLPGTMLAARPATVLAALAIRIGLKPLFKPASEAMIFWRDKWNNLEVPETWNSSCLGLLLDADAEYKRSIKDNVNPDLDETGLLFKSDRQLFSRLVAYQLAGANLLTTLSAEIGWTPFKTNMPLGHVVQCKGCDFPRSVTIMAEGRKCGLCVAGDYKDKEHKEKYLTAHVTKEDDASTTGAWVECSVRTCRAQYVCYNTGDLNVRPKCHYCRSQGGLPQDQRSGDPAPTVECVKCLSKVIWPREYRVNAPSPFNCQGCVSGRKTIETVETSADKLSKENGRGWLLRNDKDTVQESFQRSLFRTITAAGIEAFVSNVEVLPALDPAPSLTIQGKLVRNQDALKEQLGSWIRRRTVEKSYCSLCFSLFPNARLLPACRRNGCHQQICEGCLNGWYGLNKAGTIINTAALFCPFCRRPPAARTLAAYGMGIHAVGNLRNAIEEKGQWIHAWCIDCGDAQRYMERECARGAPEPVEDWTCEPCMLRAEAQALAAEQAAREALQLVANQDEARRRAEADLRAAKERRRELSLPVKECPGCHTPTMKISGCNHVTCTIRQCHTHWCWACGKKFDSRTIYSHLRSAHGTYYDDDGYDDEYNTDEDDY